MDINETKSKTKSKTKFAKAGKTLKNLVRVLVVSTKVLNRGKSNTNDAQDIASEKFAFVPANASTTPPRFPVIARTNTDKQSEGPNAGYTGSAMNAAMKMNGVVGLGVGGTLNAVEALRSVGQVDRPSNSNSNIVGVIQDVTKSSAVGQPVDSTPSVPATTRLTSTPTTTTITATLSTSPTIAAPGTSASIPGVPENANTVEDEEMDGKKKKNKKPTKKKTDPSQLIERAVEFSPKAMEVVKRGLNTAVAINPTSGASNTNSGINAISKAMSSAVNGTGTGTTSKITDTLMSKRKEFDTIIPVGPVAFLLKGNIDRTDLSIDASFNVKVGFITHKLGKVVGNLKTGVRIKFGLSGVLTGQARFYLPLKKVKGKGKGKGVKAEKEGSNNGQDGKEGGNGEVMKDAERSKWLWLDIKVTVFKEDIGPLSLPLIPLRFGHAKSTSDALSISTLTEHLIIEDTRSSGTKRSIEITRQSITISRPSAELDAYAYCSVDTTAMARHSIDERFIDTVWHDDTNRTRTTAGDADEWEWGCEGFAVGYHS